jgi:hypothetical protein
LGGLRPPKLPHPPTNCVSHILIRIAEEQLPQLRQWQVKLGVVFLMPAMAETLQYFGLDALGSTFDPLDYAMYAAGAACAVIVDMQVFPRLFDFWGTEKVVG